MTRTLVECRNICKRYGVGDGEILALDGVNVTITAGEHVAVTGPSGSGKSTFINIIGCLDIATRGEVLLDGENVTTLGARKLARVRNRHFGFVFQQFNLLPRSSVYENITLPLLYSGVPEREWPRRVESCLRQVGLVERMHHASAQLSGGQQQRVAIARALVNEPQIILADEPTGALDTRTGREIMELFAALNSRGKTVVIVTHDPEVAACSARQLQFRDGRLVVDQQRQVATA